MKRKETIIVVLVFTAFCSVLISFGNSRARTFESPKFDEPNLVVKINPSKGGYVQGEVVALDVEILNSGQSDVFLRGTDARSGFVKIFVSEEDQKFKQYSHSAWIGGRSGGATLKPGETVKSSATLLWNFKPQVSHLNEIAARNASQGLVLTDYVFDKPGTYFVKAVLIIPDETQTRIESQPVQIVVETPTGEDLDVWNQIKDNGEIGYFIQEGSIRSPKPEERKKVLDEIEQLSRGYSNSIVANQLRQSLDKFRTSEGKRNETLEKHRKQKSEN